MEKYNGEGSRQDGKELEWGKGVVRNRNSSRVCV